MSVDVFLVFVLFFCVWKLRLVVVVVFLKKMLLVGKVFVIVGLVLVVLSLKKNLVFVIVVIFNCVKYYICLLMLYRNGELFRVSVGL